MHKLVRVTYDLCLFLLGLSVCLVLLLFCLSMVLGAGVGIWRGLH